MAKESPESNSTKESIEKNVHTQRAVESGQVEIEIWCPVHDETYKSVGYYAEGSDCPVCGQKIERIEDLDKESGK